MKTLTSLFTFLALVIILTGCQERPEVPPFEEPTTGTLTFELKCSDGYVEGAEIGLTFDSPQSQEIIYLEILTTDENGKAQFVDLEPGEYYYLIKFPGEDGFADLGLGSIEISAGSRMGSPIFMGKNCKE